LTLIQHKIYQSLSRSETDSTGIALASAHQKLGWRYRCKRIAAVHPVLGKVLLIVSVFYDEKHDKYRRILLITTDLDMRAPTAIWVYKRRWRVEVFFKSVKQQLRLGVFRLRKEFLQSIRSHFQLRGLGYLLLSQVRRFGFLHRSRWSLRKVTGIPVVTQCSDKAIGSYIRMKSTFAA
jgi:hypothetical protein